MNIRTGNWVRPLPGSSDLPQMLGMVVKAYGSMYADVLFLGETYPTRCLLSELDKHPTTTLLWHAAEECVPEFDEDVLMLASGRVSTGYFDTCEDCWWNYDSRSFTEDVTHWSHLPSVCEIQEVSSENLP